MTRDLNRREPANMRVWSAASIRQLKALWDQPDLTAAVIAERLGMSRNAVLGKAYRLGLSKPRKLRPPKAPPRPRTPRRPPSPPRTPVARVHREDLAPQAGSLETLRPHACHWPIGDPKLPDFGFCGRPAPGRTYCDLHWARAHAAG